MRTEGADSLLLRRLPGSHLVSGGQSFFRMLSVLPRGLPPEVAKGMTVLPAKS